MSEWFWVAGLGAAGGAASAWLARLQAAPPRDRRALRRPGATRRRLALLTLSAGTAAAIAWMVGGPAALRDGGLGLPSALAFVWIGFVTAGWLAAIRDVHVLRAAVCRAATAPAAHPDTVHALAHASPDAVYDAVAALLPRRLAR